MYTDILIISGKINSGKSTACKDLVRRLQSSQKNIGGILSIPFWRHGEKKAYYALDISTEEGTLLATTEPVYPAYRYGRFFFPLSGFSFAKSVLYAAADLSEMKKQNKKDILIIDEIGPLECLGQGFTPLLRDLMDRFSGILLLVMREEYTRKLCTYFKIPYNKEKIFYPGEEIPL